MILEQHCHVFFVTIYTERRNHRPKSGSKAKVGGSSLMCATKRQVLVRVCASAPSLGLTVRPKHPAAPMASQSHPQRPLP